jgi:hypothetical protein
LVESFKLVPRPLDEGPRPKSGKLQAGMNDISSLAVASSTLVVLTYKAPVLEGISIGSNPKNGVKRIAPDLENQESV